MELVLSNVDLDPLPKALVVSNITSNDGLLNSNYKQVVKCNFKNERSQSIFGIRQHVKRARFQLTPSVDVLLKVSVFVIALAVIL
ncbi:hypothetical protein RM697_11895 [Ichthyenterobacterium sp. W332]|uniref:Uncharacterized protein n=1 Tax=Microcosmobacter mediterraneus TaxID=3075607 RepID=A0ABU2YMH0_9FLAO|nr:hypothetical protein [Ichthyenterobacterium sp. W332]MDT0559358.1 hypothetical protein [Ichthyenterobacterium sp. W332]